MTERWIKLHTSLIGWEWYDDANTLRLFIHCLFKANWRDQHWHGIKIERGSFVTSLDKLSSQLNLSIQQIRTSLDKLIKTGEITKKPANKYTHIEVNNYNYYQASNTEITNKQQTNNKQITTNKNNKNNKNNNIYSSRKCLTDDLVREVAEHYSVSFKAVENLKEDLILYCKRNSKRYKDYKAALQTWVRTALKQGKLKKEVKEELPEMPEISESEREANIKRIREMKLDMGVLDA